MKITKITYNETWLPGILTIIFIILKVTGVTTWSWWWVLCPLWIPFLFVLVSVIIITIVYALFKLIK